MPKKTETPKTETPETPAPIAKGQAEHDRHSIMEVRTYVDDGGRKVNEFSQMFGKTKMAPFYKGFAMIQVKVAGPGGAPMPPRMQQFEFDIEATGVKKAFELFDETAEAELQSLRDKQAEAVAAAKEAAAAAKKEAGNRVVPVGGGGLVGPDGRKLKG